MRAEVKDAAEAVRGSLDLLARRMDIETASHRREEFDARIEDPNLWNDPAAAQKLMRDRQALIDQMETHASIEGTLTDNLELIEMGEAEGDEEIVEEAEEAILALKGVAAAKELEALLDGEADGNDAFLEISVGAGGNDANDFVAMLARMYARWAEKRGFEVELQSEQAGAEVGLRSITYQIKGRNAYGWLKTESGTHRLVRISPFAGTRETSFAAVGAYPVIDDDIEIEVNPADIRIDTFRASGAGGQHVNTTDSAVRITHAPTGIVVTSSEKSQHQNRDIAMKALKSRLYQMELDRRNAEVNALHEAKGDAAWGNQIRNYVLNPYQQVKDLRTAHTTSDTQGVLDGDLDAFMAATLAQGASGKSRADAAE